MDNKTERTKLPKTAFDSEYSTEYLREVRFLSEKGIKYTFVKKTPDYGVSQYKYTKNPTLFAALVEFYSMIEAERKMRRNSILSPEQIRQAQDILEKAATIVQNKDDVLKNDAPKDDTL